MITNSENIVYVSLLVQSVPQLKVEVLEEQSNLVLGWRLLKTGDKTDEA